MENISIEDINLRLKNIKGKVLDINKKIENTDESFSEKFDFARNIGIKVDILNDTTKVVSENLERYVDKVDSLISKYNNVKEDEDITQEYKLLSNILVLDDAKLKNINELLEDNFDLTKREYINLFAGKANELIREEETKEIDRNIEKLSKISIVDKITGKAKMKRALAENYSLKRVELINKKYVPENRSLYEIISITNNCGYKSEKIDSFVKSIVNKFELENPSVNALVTVSKDKKIPFFFNKEMYNKINAENTQMLSKINGKKETKAKVTEYKVYRDMLKNDVTTLELLSYDREDNEVI